MFLITKRVRTLFWVSLCIVLLSACGETSTTLHASTSTQTPASGSSGSQSVAPADKTQSGDISDTQAFVSYLSPKGNYTLDVPEGWARIEAATDVSFVDKLNGVQVAIMSMTTAPTLESVRAQQVHTLQNNGHVVQDIQVRDVPLSTGNAVLLTFTSNSEPDAVTGKQIRLENNQYLFFKKGKIATLTLWAPLGADNVDQWSRMFHSFRWV